MECFLKKSSNSKKERTVVSQVSIHGRFNKTAISAHMSTYPGYKFYIFVWKLQQ